MPPPPANSPLFISQILQKKQQKNVAIPVFVAAKFGCPQCPRQRPSPSVLVSPSPPSLSALSFVSPSQPSMAAFFVTVAPSPSALSSVSPSRPYMAAQNHPSPIRDNKSGPGWFLPLSRRTERVSFSGFAFFLALRSSFSL